ncbi:MAG: hypothetical protein OXL37_12400 [Chloroflexota bacterium]|nr:hypothetical protein [Chloroflexota bacterium]MDE2960882.1 hypothetical protein [Chloroflexota bacterium]
MGDFNVNATILFAFMGFMGLLQLAILGALFRLLLVVGRIQGDINGLRGENNRIWEAIAGLRQEIADLRTQIADLREQVAENRGLLRALHERVDLVLRHRHDEPTGAVILTPTEPVPDPAAD